MTTFSLQEFAALVQEFAGLEAPKTDSEADLTIWPEFLKPTKSVWANRFSTVSYTHLTLPTKA